MPRPRSRPAQRHTTAAALATAVFLASLPLNSPPTVRAADATWTSPTSGRWLDPTQWSTAAVPTSSDTATINTPGPYTVTLDANTSTGPVTLNAPNATLSLAGPSYSAIYFSTGPLTVSAGTLAFHAGANTTYQVRPASFTNAGTITFDTDAALSSTTPRVDFETSSAKVVNSGTIQAHAAPPPSPGSSGNHYVPFYNFTGSSGATFTNSGSIHADPGSIVQLNGYTLNNTGSLDGEVELYSGTLNYTGGSCSPTTPVYLSSSPLNIAPSATNGNFILAVNGTLNSNIPAGNTVTTYGTTTTAWRGAGYTLTNAGRLAIGYYPGTIPTTTTVSPSFVLSYASYPYSSSSVLLNTGTLELNNPNVPASSITGSVTNQGTITVNAPNTTYSKALTTVSGNFTQNAGSLTISPATSLSLFGTAHFYFNGGTVSGPVSLDNSTVHFANGLANTGGGTFTYSTTVASNSTPPAATPFTGDIPSGATFVHTAGTATYTFSLPSFTNNGTLRTSYTSGSAPIYTLNGGTGTLTNTGSLGGNFGTDRGIYLQIDGNLTNTGDIKAYNLSVYKGTFNQNAGTLYVDTYCDTSQGTLNYNGGTLSGKPLTLSASTLNIAPNTNPASFLFYGGSNTLHGSLSAGSALAFDARYGGSTIVSLSSAPFTNAGTLSFAATPGACTATLTVTGSGTLTNTGTLSVTQGKGGTRTLNANIVNTGTLSIGPGATLTLNGSLSTSTPLDLQGTLDLKLSPLTWTPAPPTAPDTLRSLLATSHLISSATDPTHRLAYLLNPTTSTITVKPTINGDANLDGQITPDDYALLDQGLATHGTYWWQGDFNYDGQVDQNDYLLIDTTYLSLHPSSAPTLLAGRQSQFGPAYVQQLLTAVPEPTSLTACGLSLLPLLRRRKNQT